MSYSCPFSTFKNMKKNTTVISTRFPGLEKRQRLFWFSMLLSLLPWMGFSQAASSHDDIYLEVSSVNVNTVFYGEPYRVFFRFSNKKNSVNHYHKPASQVNIKFNLKNVATGK